MEDLTQDNKPSFQLYRKKMNSGLTQYYYCMLSWSSEYMLTQALNLFILLSIHRQKDKIIQKKIISKQSETTCLCSLQLTHCSGNSNNEFRLRGAEYLSTKDTKNTQSQFYSLLQQKYCLTSANIIFSTFTRVLTALHRLLNYLLISRVTFLFRNSF